MKFPGKAAKAIPYAVFLIAGPVISVLLGQDRFSDLRNYHLYNAWAFLTHRDGRDIYPADIQTFFNPLGDILLYRAGMGPLADCPRFFAAVQGFSYSLLLLVLFSVLRMLRGLQGGPELGNVGVVAALLIGATGTAILSQVGLSSGEMPVAVLVLLGLRVVLATAGLSGDCRGLCNRRFILSGLCVGLAAGIKPTAVVYVPAVLATVAVVAPEGGWRVRPVSACAAGCVAGFLMTYGWWAVHLWRLTGNPVFPMFNGIFHSVWTAPETFTDQRYKPRSVLQWIAYPFFWLSGRERMIAEPGFADARFALTMLACLLLVPRVWWQRRSAGPGMRACAGVLAFTVTGYVVWLRLYSILRYMIPIEAMSGYLIVAALCDVFRVAGKSRSRLWRDAAVCVAVVFLMVTSRYPGFGHTDFSARTFDVGRERVAADSVVLLMGRNLSYLAPFFEPAATLRFVGMNNLLAASVDFWPGQAVHDLLRSGAPVYMVRSDDPAEDDHMALLKRFLPDFTVSDCREVSSALNGKKRRESAVRSYRLSLCRVIGKPA